MAVDVTPADVRARAGATESEWPDTRINPVLTVAAIKARAARSDSALSGDAAELWRAGVVALTWHMLTSATTGGGGAGQIKKVRDGDLETEFTTGASAKGWWDEALLFIPELAAAGRVPTFAAVPTARMPAACGCGGGAAPMCYDPFGNPITPPDTGGDSGTVPDGEDDELTSFPFTVESDASTVTVSLAPYRVRSSAEGGVFALSTRGPVFNQNITIAPDRRSVTLQLDPDGDDAVQWQAGDNGEVFATVE